MSSKLAIPVLLLLLSGCTVKRENTYGLDISSQIDSAERTSSNLNQRLLHALVADSIACASNVQQYELTTAKLVSTIYLKKGNMGAARKYLYKAAELARKKKDNETLGITLNNLALSYSEQAELDSALYYYNQAHTVFQKTGDQMRLAQGKINVGIVYKKKGNYQVAFDTTVQAIPILQSKGSPKDLAVAYTTIGNILKELRRLSDALRYHEMALKLREDEKDSANIAGSLNNIGNIHKLQKKYENALAAYEMSMSIKVKMGLEKATTTTLENIAEVYAEQGRHRDAERYFNLALTLASKYDDKDEYVTISNRLSRLLLNSGKFVEAEEVARHVEVKCASSKLSEQQLENNVILSKVYEQMGKAELALPYANNALTIQKAIFDNRIASEISRMQIQYETKQKDLQIEVSNRLQTVQITQIRLQLILIALLLSLAILFYRSAKFRKRAKVITEALMAELNHRVKNNLQIISDMLHLQMSIVKEDTQVALIQASLSRVQSINIIHSLLNNQEIGATIALKDLFNALLANLAHSYQVSSELFEIKSDIDDISINTDTAIIIGLVANEIITNIFKHSTIPSKGGVLKVMFKQQDALCKLVITDNCAHWNIDQERKRKGGLGIYLIETLVKQVNGKLHFNNNNQENFFSVEFNKNT